MLNDGRWKKFSYYFKFHFHHIFTGFYFMVFFSLEEDTQFYQISCLISYELLCEESFVI